MSQSRREKEYALSFKFKEHVNRADHDILSDYLYKFAFNLTEAHEYAELLNNMDDLSADKDNFSELLNRINIMTLQCFALCIRRIADATSERSVRKLLVLANSKEISEQYADELVTVYRHYKTFLDKSVVHQDALSIYEGVSLFPDTKTVNEDLQLLREIYTFLCIGLCDSYLNVREEGHYFGFELDKLLLAQDDFAQQENYD